MKAKGPKSERETVITFNDSDKLADVQTHSNRVYKTLLKRGFLPYTDEGRSASFKIPKNNVSFRTSNPISEKRRNALERARSKVRPRSIQNSLSVQPKMEHPEARTARV